MRLGLGLSSPAPSGGGDVTAPTITSTNTASVEENATLSKSLTANEAVTWTITGGADSAQFEISGSTLRWSSNGTRDYEAPADADTNNQYVVQVTATDAANNSSNQTITVTVTDVSEASFGMRAGSPQMTTGPTSDSTSCAVTLAPHQVGDTLIVAIAVDGNPTITCTGWTSIRAQNNSTNNKIQVFKRDTAAASSSETNPTFTLDGAQQFAAAAYSFTGSTFNAEATSTTGISASVDPVVLTPSGGSQSYIWIVAISLNGGGSNVSVFPTNYTNSAVAANGDAGGAACAVAQRSTTATSENPGTCTNSNTQWAVITLGCWGT